MESQPQQRRLGRGLSALLGGQGPTGGHEPRDGDAENSSFDPAVSESGELRHVNPNRIEANPFQPRREFDGDELNELAGSVREHGVLSPLLVREVPGGYQLVAGERRLRAARKSGLNEVPVRVVDVVDQTACEFALEENLKRSDLNDIEKARAFRRYLDQFQTTQDELAKQLSMSRPALGNMLRLLELPEVIQQAVERGHISAGHARAILSIDEEADRIALCTAIQADGLSVRKAEAEAKRLKSELREPEDDASDSTSGDSTVASDEPQILPMHGGGDEHETAHIRDVAGQLRDHYGVDVSIKLSGPDCGRIELPFANNEEFERLLGLLRGQGVNGDYMAQEHGNAAA